MSEVKLTEDGHMADATGDDDDEEVSVERKERCVLGMSERKKGEWKPETMNRENIGTLDRCKQKGIQKQTRSLGVKVF